MQPCNHMYLDTAAIMKVIKEYQLKSLQEVEEKFQDYFATEIIVNGVGKMRWREEAGSKLREIEQIVVDDYIELQAGIDEASFEEDQRVRIHVTLFGNQSGGPLVTKPGANVYGSDINGKHESTASSIWYLPDGFNMTADGEKMVENAIKLTQKFFDAAVEQAAAAIPETLFSDNLIVVGG